MCWDFLNWPVVAVVKTGDVDDRPGEHETGDERRDDDVNDEVELMAAAGLF